MLSKAFFHRLPKNPRGNSYRFILLNSLLKSITHDLSSMRSLILGGGGIATIKGRLSCYENDFLIRFQKPLILFWVEWLTLQSSFPIWRLVAALPPFKCGCSVIGRLETSNAVKNSWESICCYLITRFVLFLRLSSFTFLMFPLSLLLIRYNQPFLFRSLFDIS